MRGIWAVLALMLCAGSALADGTAHERTGRSDASSAGGVNDPSNHDRDGNGVEDAFDPNSPDYQPHTTPGVDYTGWCCRYPDNPATPEWDGVLW